MTIESLAVDLRRCWEVGQAYVALSRAKSLAGLKVLSLPRNLDVPYNAVVDDFMHHTFGAGYLEDARPVDVVDTHPVGGFKFRGAARGGDDMDDSMYRGVAGTLYDGY